MGFILEHVIGDHKAFKTGCSTFDVVEASFYLIRDEEKMRKLSVGKVGFIICAAQESHPPDDIHLDRVAPRFDEIESWRAQRTPLQRERGEDEAVDVAIYSDYQRI